MSVLGFGAAALGGVYGRVSGREARRVVRCARDRGINYFDTAPAYGDGLSEIRLGKALAGRRREIVLASKAGRFQAGGRLEFDFSAARLRRSLAESLARLNTDYLDVFQLHDVEYADFSQILDEALPELQAMKREGTIRAVGVTGRPTELLARLAEQARPDMILSYGHYTLLSTAMMERLAPVCASLGIGLVNAAPLEMGLLAPGGPGNSAPAAASLWRPSRFNLPWRIPPWPARWWGCGPSRKSNATSRPWASGPTPHSWQNCEFCSDDPTGRSDPPPARNGDTD